MAKLTTSQKKRVGLLAKAIYDFKAKRAGVPAAKAAAVWEAALNNLDTDKPTGTGLKQAILNDVTGGKPQAGADWLAIIEKLLPIILQLLPIIFGLFA